jgi:hypothetical protein
VSAGAAAVSAGPDDRRRHLRELRKLNAQRIAELDLPCPCDLPTLCRRLGRQRNRPITLVPMPIPSSHPCGMWAAVEEEDLIFFDVTTTSAHQEHIILHELGHIIGCHDIPARLDDESARRLFPNLDPDAVRGLLGRAAYDDISEQEAEIIAYLLREKIGGLVPRSVPKPREDDDVLERVERTLI